MKNKLVSSLIASGVLLSPAYISAAEKADSKTASGSDWEGSLILDMVYFDRSQGGELAIHGMPSGGHNHGREEGLNIGHSELVASGSVTEHLSAKITAAITKADAEDEDELEIELEEAFLETQGLGNGVSVKAGRFLSDVGYLSNKHTHEWDFTDQPLIYTGMFGSHPKVDGVQINYVAPTDTYLEVGSELIFNDDFPAGETKSDLRAGTVYAKVGGDVGASHSWLAGIGHWRANNITDRRGESHAHGGGSSETPSFAGDSHINTINALYKWAPNGNAKERNLKIQAEYFRRKEDGKVDMLEADGTVAETSTYQGNQSGWYAQAVYQFQPRWRVGTRYERLKLSNTGSEEDVLEEAGLHSEGHVPERKSIMVDYSPREYSRFRLQFNRDERTETPDNQILMQYTHSFGSHGAHGF